MDKQAINPFLSFGPFDDLDKKNPWVIVGCGPTMKRYGDVVGANTIALNRGLLKMGKADVWFVSHYENLLYCFGMRNIPPITYLANPLHVGYRCVPVHTHNLIDFRAWEKDVRFFEKETDLQASAWRSHTLYAKHTIATAALHLLYRNGIEEATFCGIDGGKEHTEGLSAPHVTDPISYDEAREDFLETGRKLKIKLIEL